MSRLEILIGNTTGQRIVVFGTIGIYLGLGVFRPSMARTSATQGVSTIAHLGVVIVAALFLASVIETALPQTWIRETIGGHGGIRTAVIAGLLAGLLPGGPYATYPIIDSIHEGIPGESVLLAMLLGYGLISVGRIPFGLVFFPLDVIGLRLVIGISATVLVGIVLGGAGRWVRRPPRELL